MNTAYDKLAQSTGLRAQDVERIAAEVKANQHKLQRCPWHDFEPVPGALRFGLPSKYRCIHCGGTVDSHAYHWHELGRRKR